MDIKAARERCEKAERFSTGILPAAVGYKEAHTWATHYSIDLPAALDRIEELEREAEGESAAPWSDLPSWKDRRIEELERAIKGVIEDAEISEDGEVAMVSDLLLNRLAELVNQQEEE